MFGSLGGAELIVVLVLALLMFGPRKLPQIGRTIGGALSEFRKATLDFKSSLEREVELDEVKSARREINSTVDEIRDLGVSRGSILDDGEPRQPSEASGDPPAEEGATPGPGVENDERPD
jgi:Tat protein translocase TatB subunit